MSSITKFKRDKDKASMSINFLILLGVPQAILTRALSIATCSSTFKCLAKSFTGRHSLVNTFKPLRCSSDLRAAELITRRAGLPTPIAPSTTFPSQSSSFHDAPNAPLTWSPKLSTSWLAPSASCTMHPSEYESSSRGERRILAARSKLRRRNSSCRAGGIAAERTTPPPSGSSPAAWSASAGFLACVVAGRGFFFSFSLCFFFLAFAGGDTE
uniref:Uncharacterized protein n=1 Tax=Arundo donax TaxID=35708 RepID=A0A0A9CTS2_ARUDO